MRHVAAVFKPLYKLLYCVLVIILKCHNYSNCLYIKQLWAKKKKKRNQNNAPQILRLSDSHELCRFLGGEPIPRYPLICLQFLRSDQSLVAILWHLGTTELC